MMSHGSHYVDHDPELHVHVHFFDLCYVRVTLLQQNP